MNAPHATETRAALHGLIARRSVSPKRLRAPGITPDKLQLVLQAALRAPDHGNLRPWRVLEFTQDTRAGLADLFEQEKLRRDPLASPADRKRAREHAERAPSLLAFIVCPDTRARIPVREQWLSAGAALGNLLNAAHQLGYGAVILSGDRCFDPVLARQLGLHDEERLAGFVCIGSIAQEPPALVPQAGARVHSRWRGAEATEQLQQSRDSLKTTPQDAPLATPRRVMHAVGWGDSTLLCGAVSPGPADYRRFDLSQPRDRLLLRQFLIPADMVALTREALGATAWEATRTVCADLNLPLVELNDGQLPQSLMLAEKQL